MSAAALWLLVVVANAAPLMAGRPGRGTPLDFGLTLPDGQRLLGDHKSWRGLVLSLGCTASCAALLGLPMATGLTVAALAMLGDMLASLTKRRLGIAPGGMALALDQLPESLLPLILIGRPALSWTAIALLALAFMALDLFLRMAVAWRRSED